MDPDQQKDQFKAQFYLTYRKVIQTYPPTNDAMDEEKDEFYN